MLLALTVMLLQTLTYYIAPIKVRFLPMFDKIGGVLLAAWAGWLLVQILTVAFHTAPLARDSMGGSFRPHDIRVLGFPADRMWLSFSRKLSMGSLGRSADPNKPTAHIFESRPGDFIARYASRRKEYEQLDSMLAGDAD